MSNIDTEDDSQSLKPTEPKIIREATDRDWKPLNFTFKNFLNDGSVSGSQYLMRIVFPGQMRTVGEFVTRKAIQREAPYIWLRDSCRCDSCVNPDTLQRIYDVFSAPEDIQPVYVEMDQEGLLVKWNDDHLSSYSFDWLNLHLRVERHREFWSRGQKLPEQVPMLAPFDDSIKHNPPSVHYEEVMSGDEGVRKWMCLIQAHGFSYVDNCPICPKKTKELLERIAFIRETHYGGFYDFTSDLSMKDTAYTAEALDAHTDTTYFTDPVGHQMFHLLSHTDGTGGESLLVDGYHCAYLLQREDPAAFEILCTTETPFHASGNDGVSIRPRNARVFSTRKQKVKEWTPKRNERHSPLVDQVRWNRYDRGTWGGSLSSKHDSISNFANITGAMLWYDAARKWTQVLKRSENEYWAQLEPGRPIIIDNFRMLHGRSAFTGNRRMCGGYLNRDDYMSRLTNLFWSKEDLKMRI